VGSVLGVLSAAGAVGTRGVLALAAHRCARGAHCLVGTPKARLNKLEHTLSEGTYLLRSNVTDWSDEKLWKAYIQLTQAEAAFRIQKDQLAIRPIWHQRADRVQAHILVCFLAFVLWKTLELWQARAGLGNSPRTLLEEFARIHAHDVILPTHAHGEIRLRCVTQPDAAQAALLDRLGIVLPKRIRLPEIALAETAARVTA
jgi:hypothetical protein